MDAHPSAAYEVGRMIGMIMVPVVLFILFAAYSASLYLLGRSRHIGWLISTVVFSLPLAALFIAMIFGIAFTMRSSTAPEAASTFQSHEAADLLTAPFQPLKGRNFDYTLSVPDRDSWKTIPPSGDFDRIIAYRDLYIGIIAERVGIGDIERMREFVEQTLTTNSTTRHIDSIENLAIDGRPWVAFTADATREKMHLRYRYFLYTDNRRSVQIIAWTSPALFDRNKPVVEQIAQSFHFGKD